MEPKLGVPVEVIVLEMVPEADLVSVFEPDGVEL
jgi:hypothetical protein